MNGRVREKSISPESLLQWLAIGIVVSAACLRLLPHVPNMVPVTAIALFAGAKLADRRSALLLVLAIMFLSDLVIGFDVVSPFVYLALAMTVMVGKWVGSGDRALRVLGGTLFSSVMFFVVTNLGVWLMQSLYPKSLEGLLQCYVMALPFFRNSLIADIVFVAVLFGVFGLAQRRLPIFLPARAARTLP